MAKNGAVQLGIQGLDAILHGGIPRGNVILVEGTTGTGKTLLGIEFIYRGITEFDEPGIIVVFETSPDKIIRDAATLGWDLAKLQAEHKLQIIFTSPQVSRAGIAISGKPVAGNSGGNGRATYLCRRGRFVEAQREHAGQCSLEPGSAITGKSCKNSLEP